MSNLIRIAVFYDGNYFNRVSNFYKFNHTRRKRISISGLHEFIESKASELEKTDKALCQVVEAHYFRGRFSVRDLESYEGKIKKTGYANEQLKNDRIFDEVLSLENVTTHFMRMDTNQSPPKEVGIDVWFALEAYDLAVHKRFDILALIGCDGDYVPLIRKLNSIGTRVMLLAWDFTMSDGSVTRVSQRIIDEASYPVMMDKIIDDRAQSSSAVVNNLFVD